MTHNLTAEVLRFDYCEPTLGLALVALSDPGVAVISPGGDRQRLRCEQSDAVRGARLVEDETGLDGAIAHVVALVDAPRLGPDLPLDRRDSELELAVWEVLRAIPPAETRAYGALADALPVAATARNVGAACAANVLAVAVPCHRVAKADGSTSGCRWGVQRRRDLLARETRA